MEEYEVAIVGGGIVGTALLYILTKYTSIKKIALLEKYSKIGSINSHRNNNSQTLHFGDIETNYSAEKARKVKNSVGMLARYVEDHVQEAYKKYQKMILAVGDKEVEELEKRYREFREIFPNLKRMEREEISKVEPRVVEGRDNEEKILALYSEDGYTVDFGKVSQSFVDNSKNFAKENGKKVDVFLDTPTCFIKKEKNNYSLNLEKGGQKFAKVVIVAAGGMSLTFARELGYGLSWILLPVAGSFYYTPQKVLNGKVYTMQNPKLPFAAVHGDPDVYEENCARFGPTAKVLPMLERHRYKTVIDFLRLFRFEWRAFQSIFKILSDWTVFKYILRNFIYDIPVIGKISFMRTIRKITPSLKMREIKFAKGFGGIRPQVVNTETRGLEMGEARIRSDNIIFYITPSPGASVSLNIAKKDAKEVVKMLGESYKFDEGQVEKDFSWPKSN